MFAAPGTEELFFVFAAVPAATLGDLFCFRRKFNSRRSITSRRSAEPRETQGPSQTGQAQATIHHRSWMRKAMAAPETQRGKKLQVALKNTVEDDPRDGDKSLAKRRFDPQFAILEQDPRQ